MPCGWIEAFVTDRPRRTGCGPCAPSARSDCTLDEAPIFWPVNMYALSPVSHPVDLVQIAFDSLRERICVLDCDGAIILTNHAWSQSARENGADLNRCGQGVNYLQVCRTAMGQFSERALEAAIGIETVLRGAVPQFTLDYPFPS